MMNQRRFFDTMQAIGRLSQPIIPPSGALTLDKARDTVKKSIAQIMPLLSTEFKPLAMQNEGPVVHRLFQISAETKPSIAFLDNHIARNETTSQDLRRLTEEYQQTMAKAIGLVERMKEHNRSVVEKTNPQKTLIVLARQPDAKAFQKHLKDYETFLNKESMSKALRNAVAANQVDNVLVLLKTGVADILGAGPDTGKIPLHYAIEKGLVTCIGLLLSAVRTAVPFDDYYNPVGQLSFADKSGKTPMDYIPAISNAAMRNDVIDTVMFELNIVPSHPKEDGHDLRSPLRAKLAAMRKQEGKRKQTGRQAEPTPSSEVGQVKTGLS